MPLNQRPPTTAAPVPGTAAIMGLLLCLACCVGLTASARPLLDLDAAANTREEVLETLELTDAPFRDDGTVVLGPGEAVATQMFAYEQLSTVTVELEASTADISRGERPWNVGRAILGCFGADGQELAHFDLSKLDGTTDWQTSRLAREFPAAVKQFRLVLVNQGVTGTARFRGLRIGVSDHQTQDLIGDSSFEGSLGVDHWYVPTQHTAWDGRPTTKPGHTTAQDEAIRVEGRYAVTLAGTATLVSKLFPYDGERLLLSGWLRTQDLQAAAESDRGAGIQLVGFDADGGYVTHRDLQVLAAGTQSWQHVQATLTMPETVQQVQVWLRHFDGAAGQSWYDQVRLQRVPADGSRPPFDAAQATVTLDLDAAAAAPINHRVWSGIDVSYASWLLRPEAPGMLEYLQAAGFEMLRLHEVHNAFQIYMKDDEDGNPIYDWDRFDQAMDMVVRDYGMTPHISLESTPPALDRPGTRKADFTNRHPPADYAKWGAYTEAFILHAIERYGKEEVSGWYWELWNEPMAERYYKGTIEEYQQISAQTLLAVERVNQAQGMTLRMGLGSGCPGDFDLIVLEWLAAQEKLHLITHASFHFYGGIRTPVDLLGRSAELYHTGYRKRYPGLPDIEVGCTEWNGNSMHDAIHDMPWSGTLIVKMARLMLDEDIDYSTHFVALDHPHLAKRTFQGWGGLITSNLVPKPAYNAFLFLDQLKGGHRVPLSSSNNPIDALAVRMPDGALRIALTNYDEDTTRLPYSTTVDLVLDGAAPGTTYAMTRHWAADREHGDSYAKWQALGEPDKDDDSVLPALRQAATYAELPLVQPAANPQTGTFTLSIELPAPGIRFIELRPVAAP